MRFRITSVVSQEFVAVVVGNDALSSFVVPRKDTGRKSRLITSAMARYLLF
jgi:hypothetical protein